MTFAVKDQTQIKSDILRDIQNILAQASVTDDSDYGVRAAGTSAAIEGLYQHQQWISRQLFADTADVEIMESAHAALRNVTRKPGTYATGSIKFTGIAGSNIAVGTEAKTVGGLAFITTVLGTIDGTGNATVTAQASLVGIASNVVLNTALTLTSPPAGVDSNALSTAFLAGTDIETDQALLDRLLFLLRNPPSSGTKNDYIRWATEVAGCDSAFVYPLRNGVGTTDIIITSAGNAPSVPLLALVQAHIDEMRSVGLNTVNVFGPALLVQNFDIQVKISGITLLQAQGLISAALNSYYASLLPGQTFVRSVAEALVSDIVGITDRLFVAPAANVVPIINSSTVEWCRKGTLSVSLMP